MMRTDLDGPRIAQTYKASDDFPHDENNSDNNDDADACGG